MKSYVFLGPPGVGKGTMAEMFCREHDFTHISTGDILRGEIARDSSMGRQAREIIDQGGLVPDNLISDIVSHRIGELTDSASGLVLDGYPRTLPQAERLDNTLHEHQLELTAAILFEAEAKVLISRLSRRLICRSCSAVYNDKTRPPAREGICDRCGGEIYQRSDDREETVRQRLELYQEQIAPVIAYYRERGLLRRISGAGTTSENYRALIEALS